MDKTSEKERINEMLEVIMKVAQGDYSIQVELSGEDDDFDSLAMGLNMMIDDIRTNEESLSESNLRYQLLMESSDAGINLIDKEGNFLLANSTAAKVTGLKLEDIVGKNFRDILHPELAGKSMEKFDRVMKTGIGETHEDFVKPLNRYFTESIQPVKNAAGESIGVQVMTYDITERKRAEEQLIRLSNAVTMARDSIVISDLQGNITDANEATLEMYGTDDKRDLVGKNSLDLIAPAEREKALEGMTMVLEKGYVKNREYHIITNDGNKVLVEMNSAIMKDADDKPIGFVAVSRDITVRKRMERELQEKNEQLDAQNEELRSQSEELMVQQQELIEKTREVERANQLKSEFLANMSHELRTPLNVIIGFSELMIDEVPGGINEEQRQCLDDILNSSKHLLNLINDVLDLSKIESGKVELKLENVALTVIIESLSRTMAPILTPRKQSLDIDIEEGLPRVYANKGKLGQVLLNFVDNSSKFTPDGGRLRIEAVREGDWCRVSMIDNGIGIKKENQGRIFEPFCRLNNPLAREKSGTGLGLSLVKQIVERYGGRVWVESKWGKGSRFTFTVPLATEGEPNPKEGNRR